MPISPSRPLRSLRSLAILVAAAPAALAQQPVYVEPIRELSVQQTERVIGSLRARSTSVMAALEEGVLLELDVREADRVSAGDVLARVDTRRLEASRAQLVADHAMAKATLVEREAQVDNAERDLAAVEAASRSGAVSDRDLRTARTAVRTGAALVEAARQSLTSLEATIELMDIRIHDATLRAPFDGQITARHAEVGQWVRPGDALVTLVSSERLEAWLELPERFAGRLDATAERLDLLAEASGAALSGLKPRPIPMVDERARTFALVLDIAPAETVQLALQPGMSISGVVPLGHATKRLVVAKDAVLRRGTGTLIATIGDDGIAQLAPIRVLFPTEGGFAIESLVPGALSAGQTIVVEGNERLYPGTPVKQMTREAEGQGAGPRGSGAGANGDAKGATGSDATKRPSEGPANEGSSPEAGGAHR